MVVEVFADRSGPDKPVIQSDLFANAISVIGKPADIKTVEELINKLDDAAEDNSVEVRVIPITDLKAGKMAQVLKGIYEEATNETLDITTKEDADKNKTQPDTTPKVTPKQEDKPNDKAPKVAP